jgi:hypothetical protein
MQALAKAVEAVFADLAAQGHHADDAQQNVEQPVMRPPDIGFMALWTCDSHSWQSPENLEQNNRAWTHQPHPFCGFSLIWPPGDIFPSLGWNPPPGDRSSPLG